MKRKERTAVVLGNFGIDGVSKYASQLARALILEGHEVDLIVLGKVHSPALMHESLKPRIHNHRRALSSIHSCIMVRQQTYDNIFINQAHYGVIFSIISRKSHLAPMTLILHEVPTLPGRSVLKKFRHSITKAALKRFEKIVVVTNALRHKVTETYRLEKSSISTIYPPYIPQSSPGNSHREGLLFVGRLEEEKRVDSIIWSFYRTSCHHNEKLYIVGAGSLRGSLESLADELGLSERVLFLGERDQVHEEMLKRKSLVLASDFESAGFVIIEALAAGCQVISTDCQVGPRELLADGKFGRLVPQEDSSAYDDAIISVLSTPVYFGDELQEHLKKFHFENFQKNVAALCDVNEVSA